MKALFLLIALVATAAADPHRYAIVVGANRGDPSEAQLRYGELDAERIEKILLDLGGCHAEDVVLVRGRSAEEVRRAIIAMNVRIRSDVDGSLLFVYYSGHADAEALHLGSTLLPLAELKGLVAGSSAAARVLVIDACRSGALTRVKGGRRGPAFDVQVEAPVQARGLAILTSSAAGEDSQESDDIGASFFTHYLASAMMGAADRNRDGVVSLSEAFAYASERTLAATAATLPGPQHPTYYFDLGGRGDVTLTQPSRSDGSRGILQFSQAGWFIVQRRAGSGTAELHTDAADARLSLEPGSYHVTLRATDHLLEGDVTVDGGRVVSLPISAMHRVEFAQVVRKGATARRLAGSLFVEGGVRGSVLDLGTAWRTDLGGRLDLRQLSLELRLGFGDSVHRNSHLRSNSFEFSAGVAAFRQFDISMVSVGLGLEFGGLEFVQTFADLYTVTRSSGGLYLGPLFELEVPVWRRLYARVDGAFLTYFLRSQEQVGWTIPVTYRFGGGLGVHF